MNVNRYLLTKLKSKMKNKEITFSNGNKIDSFNCCAVIEGFSGPEPTLSDQIEAWSYLIKTGECWHLQGFYGRQANSLIESGVISPEGTIDWNCVEECFEMV